MILFNFLLQSAYFAINLVCTYWSIQIALYLLTSHLRRRLIKFVLFNLKNQLVLAKDGFLFGQKNISEGH